MITFNNGVFHLATENTSYIIGVFEGQLLNLYFGKRLNSVPDIADMLTAGGSRIFSPVDIKRDGVGFSTCDLTMEYPTFGSADFRSPAFCATYADGTSATRFEYKGYEISEGKYSLPGLPAVYFEEGDKTSTLKIIMSDEVAGVTAELYYGVFENYNAITRSVKFTNNGKNAFDITKALSLSVDLRRADFDMITLNGAWARERLPERAPLRIGLQQVESTRGITSHHESPFFALVDRNADEDKGEAYGFNLIYSGNFVAGVQRDSYNCARAFMGINPQSFTWRLQKGECFYTPEAVAVYSGNGIGEMSRIFHRLSANACVRAGLRTFAARCL